MNKEVNESFQNCSFVWTYAQEWDFWIIWQIYFQKISYIKKTKISVYLGLTIIGIYFLATKYKGYYREPSGENSLLASPWLVFLKKSLLNVLECGAWLGNRENTKNQGEWFLFCTMLLFCTISRKRDTASPLAKLHNVRGFSWSLLRANRSLWSL